MNQIEESPEATLVMYDLASSYPPSWNIVFARASPLPADYGFRPQITLLKQGPVFPPAAKPLPCDIRWERDVPVTLRDGFTIYADGVPSATPSARC